MKKILLFIQMLFLVTIVSYSQTVEFKDQKFRDYFNEYDINRDREIQYSEAALVTSIETSKISDLTGLEAFVNLEYFYCYNGTFKTFNFPTLTKLKTVRLVSSPKLDSVNFISNTDLEHIHVSSLFLKSIDITNNKKLKELICTYTKITSIDISNNLSLKKATLSGSAAESLTISHDSLDYLLLRDCNYLSKLDISRCPNLFYFDCRNTPELDTICISQIHLEERQVYDETFGEYITRKTTLYGDFYDEFIVCNPLTQISDYRSDDDSKTIFKAYNLQGIEIPVDTKNETIILLYDNGKTEKIINIE